RELQGGQQTAAAAQGRPREKRDHVSECVQRGAALLWGQGQCDSENDQFNQGVMWPVGIVCSQGHQVDVVVTP
ncbi:hypothetical protein P7K49_023007, partial [Saguinus oedipus]